MSDSTQIEPSAAPAAADADPQASPPAAQADFVDQIVAVARQLGALAVLALAAAVMPGVCGILLLAYRQPVADWLLVHPESGLVIYIVVFILAAGLALLPTYSQAFIGGYVFHFGVGFPAAMAGFVGAAALAYFVARLLGGDRAMVLISRSAQARAVHQSLIGAGFGRSLLTVTLLRLPPNSPFAMMNLALAATRVPFGAYLLGTLIGLAPRTAAVIYVGSQLKDLSDAGVPSWMFWVGVVVTLIVLGILGHFISQAVHRVTRVNGTMPPPAASE